MDFGKDISVTNLQNLKYCMGKYHVSTITKVISMFYFVGSVVFGICFRCYDIVFISLVYLTPFIRINKFQPWALIPLLMLIVLDLFFPCLVLVTSASVSHNYSYAVYFMVLIVPILNCITGFYFCVTFRHFQYIKEMKFAKQIQQNDNADENSC